MAEASKKYFEGRGSRKTSTARVRLFEGEGASTVNGIPAEDYFNDKIQQQKLMQPLQETGLTKKCYFSVHTYGGGKTGQLGASVLGLSRAILDMDPDQKPALRKAGLISRDPRMKERKKYFFLKSRKKPQFSKR